MMAEEKDKRDLVPVDDGKRRNFTEELEVTGNQLVERIKELIQEGNIRRLILRDQEGRTLLEVPLTIGAVAGGALLVFYPLLAGLAAIGALLTKVRIEIVREVSGGDDDSKPSA
jgi:hypothetical protein